VSYHGIPIWIAIWIRVGSDLDPDLDPNQASTRRALRERSIKFHFPTDSSDSEVHTAHVTGDTSSESAISIRSAPTIRRALTRTRRNWTTTAVVTAANVHSELDRFGPLCKSETKAGKRTFNVSNTIASHAI
jgi:hypothetical protein